MKTDFKVYKRKIHVYRAHETLDLGRASIFPWVYAWSTNAHKTCRDAIAAAKALHPDKQFKANFAKATQ